MTGLAQVDGGIKASLLLSGVLQLFLLSATRAMAQLASAALHGYQAFVSYICCTCRPLDDAWYTGVVMRYDSTEVSRSKAMIGQCIGWTIAVMLPHHFHVASRVSCQPVSTVTSRLTIGSSSCKGTANMIGCHWASNTFQSLNDITPRQSAQAAWDAMDCEIASEMLPPEQTAAHTCHISNVHICISNAMKANERGESSPSMPHHQTPHNHEQCHEGG